MIARIKGTLIHKSAEYLIIDVQGIGYRVFVPFSTFYSLPGINEEVELNTYTVVREDLLNLYGFLTQEEKQSFQALIGIAGIGPKLANNILSGISVEDLRRAIVENDVTRLTAIPGVGKRTAERIILELRDKLGLLGKREDMVVKGIKARTQVEEDVLLALVSLGYKKRLAENVISQVLGSGAAPMNIEALLKESLKVLSNQ